MEKATTEEYRIDLFAPVLKRATGEYFAVLSDNSLDRDEERVAEKCLRKMGKDVGYVAGLIDHDNSVLKMVAEWTNRKVVKIDGHVALTGEPRFFESNPNAMIIKGMLDDGAKIGISIGAIVKEYDEEKKEYQDLELLEASFVAIPANKHGMAMRVAKSFNPDKKIKDSLNKNQEVQKMDKEYTQKDLDSAIEKKAEEMKADFEKQMKEKDEEMVKLKKDLEDSEKACGDKDDEKKKSDDKLEEAEKKLKEKDADLEELKKKSVEKSKFTSPEGDDPKDDEAEKSISEGKLPIARL